MRGVNDEDASIGETLTTYPAQRSLVLLFESLRRSERANEAAIIYSDLTYNKVF